MSRTTDRSNRRSIRLKGYDYSQKGAYFVTVCTKDRLCLFGNIHQGIMVYDQPGEMVKEAWIEIQDRFPFVHLDEFALMPNHLHGILILTGRGESRFRPENDEPKSGDHKDRPYGTQAGTIGRIIQAFKSTTTHKYISGVNRGWNDFPGKLWQRNYFEHVIRDEVELNSLRKYIAENPLKWATDNENPDCVDTGAKEELF
jgi:REP element-mobilizing transposase RayT